MRYFTSLRRFWATSPCTITLSNVLGQYLSTHNISTNGPESIRVFFVNTDKHKREEITQTMHRNDKDDWRLNSRGPSFCHQICYTILLGSGIQTSLKPILLRSGIKKLSTLAGKVNLQDKQTRLYLFLLQWLTMQINSSKQLIRIYNMFKNVACRNNHIIKPNSLNI